MTAAHFVPPGAIRSRFAAAMSDMYQREVPQYGTLLELVADINEQTLAENPELRQRLAGTNELARLSVERHGAIRVGTAEELGTLARLFAVMGMAAVGYYDLAAAGVTLHLAEVKGPVMDRLRQTHLGQELAGQRIYLSTEHAFEALTAEP